MLLIIVGVTFIVLSQYSSSILNWVGIIFILIGGFFVAFNRN